MCLSHPSPAVEAALTANCGKDCGTRWLRGFDELAEIDSSVELYICFHHARLAQAVRKLLLRICNNLASGE